LVDVADFGVKNLLKVFEILQVVAPLKYNTIYRYEDKNMHKLLFFNI